MILVHPHQIPEIDKYASQKLGIPTQTLMYRAGMAVAKAVILYVKDKEKARVSVFAGKGNNGGDGYAAALELMKNCRVTVYDVFSEGQRSEEGKHFLNAYLAKGGIVEPLTFDDKQLSDICSSDCIVDAVFGTGYSGDSPEIAQKLIELFAALEGVKKVAIDVPLGINSELGTLTSSTVYSADATVVLGFLKIGLVSYPAKKHVGKLIYDNIGLQNKGIISSFEFDSYYTDIEIASSLIPSRTSDSHKGSYGRLLMITGSSTYPGAAHLSLEAALRSGVGYVTYLGEKSMCDSLLSKLPEAIYRPVSLTNLTDAEILKNADKHSAILIGSGLGQNNADALYSSVSLLLSTEGSPLILDADAINVLSKDPIAARRLIGNSKRSVILTPHPLELSRLTGLSVDEIQRNRLSVAKSFADSCQCVLVLKGAGTIVTDGNETYINSTGSSALAKAGSGDVLAGHLSALVASGMSPLHASALAVYLHGIAADTLAGELSEFGVIPSDLPKEIARQINMLSTKHQ